MVPAPLSSLRLKIFDPFFAEHLPELERIAGPNVARSRIVIHDRETISYEVMDYDYSGGPEATGEALKAMGVGTCSGRSAPRQSLKGHPRGSMCLPHLRKNAGTRYWQTHAWAVPDQCHF